MKVLILAIAIFSAPLASSVLFQQCDGAIKPKSMSSDSCDESSERCDFYAGMKFEATVSYIAREYIRFVVERK